MKVKFISLLAVALLVVAVTDQAGADGTLANQAGYVRRQINTEQVSLDVADYLSVYRFDVGTYGVFDVAMFDNRTPLTAANFRSYADSGSYDGSFIHRSIATAYAGIGIIQGGGFTFSDADGQPTAIPTDPPVLNEPGIANTQGTIALAKTGAGPNTGTSQWYFNTANNPGLDSPANNGAYTVFGEVLYDGMDVVGRDGEGGGIADLPTWNAGGPFTNLPLSEDFNSGDILEEHMVLFGSISQVTGQTYAIVGNTNPALVSENLTGSSLTLDITADLVGRADLTVRITDGAGQWFDAALTVEVAPTVDTLSDNWDMASPTWGQGDLNEDGVIDTTDLTILASLFYDIPGGGDDIPEPATCVLMGIGGLVFLARRRR